MAADRKRRRKSSSAVVILSGLIGLLFVGLLAVGGGIVYGLHLFYEPGPTETDTPFLVERGTNLNAVTGQLVAQGLTQDGTLQPLVFRLATELLGARKRTLLPGQYLIPAHASMAEMLRIVTETKPQEFFLNVVPGETSWQVAEALNSPALNLTGEPVAPPLEGSLLAVRHDFFPGDTRQSVIAAMQKKMADTLAQLWAGHDPAIDDVIKTPQDMVTLASLVEKETGLDAERPQVASVFINRLRKHMRLQTDPSVIYGITLGKSRLDRPLTTRDLNARTPYNTYQLDGLPQGPIANPGLDALNAVAHPAKTTFLYFVAKGPDPRDGHSFASTYAEHRRNVLKYRQAVAADEAEQAREALEAQQAKDAGDTTGDTAQ
ncbi:MAG TPA: endolytic transglycosylase MltG [Devosia sp.]|nr:endolytic transglycosylase MltG [Devosia sp.]